MIVRDRDVAPQERVRQRLRDVRTALACAFRIWSKTAPPLRATHHRVRTTRPPAPVARGRGAAGRRTPPPCAPQLASRPIVTGWPAIVAHAATGRADAAKHGHAPGPTEPSGQETGRRYAARQRPMNALCVSNSQFSCCIQA